MAKEEPVLLEERLMHFLSWIQRHHSIRMTYHDPNFEVPHNDMVDMVREYVNG